MGLYRGLFVLASLPFALFATLVVLLHGVGPFVDRRLFGRVQILPRELSNALVPQSSVKDLHPDEPSHIYESLDREGLVMVRDVLDKDLLERLRAAALKYCFEDRKALSWWGYTVPNFLSLPEFAEFKPILTGETYGPIDTALQHAFKRNVTSPGKGYRYVSHNDIGCNLISPPHKDILRGPQKKFQVKDLWTPDEQGEEYRIVKLLMYLEDHDQDISGLNFAPRSHLTRDMALDRGFGNPASKAGDVMIMDQRLTHAGTSWYDQNPRVLVSLGFGSVNEFSDEFERGTIDRQDTYFRRMLENQERAKTDDSFWSKVLRNPWVQDAKFHLIGLGFWLAPPGLLYAIADVSQAKGTVLTKLIFGQ